MSEYTIREAITKLKEHLEEMEGDAVPLEKLIEFPRFALLIVQEYLAVMYDSRDQLGEGIAATCAEMGRLRQEHPGKPKSSLTTKIKARLK